MALPSVFMPELSNRHVEEYLQQHDLVLDRLGETSAVLAIQPKLVALRQGVREFADMPPFEGAGLGAMASYFETGAGRINKATKSGIYGDPREASAERG